MRIVTGEMNSLRAVVPQWTVYWTTSDPEAAQVG